MDNTASLVYINQDGERQVYDLDGPTFRETARRAGILVRTFDDPLLANCVRITVDRPADNDQLLQAVSGAERRNHA